MGLAIRPPDNEKFCSDLKTHSEAADTRHGLSRARAVIA